MSPSILQRRYLVARRIARVLWLRLRRRSDPGLWAQPRQCAVTYDSRTEGLAALIAPGARVLELGAGGRHLETLLVPGSAYFPLDLVDRGPGTVLCDLNRRPLPDLGHLRADVVVCGGVLEYLYDLPAVISWLAGVAPICVASYIGVAAPQGSWRHKRELLRRTAFAWVNHYAEAGLVELFAANGFAADARSSWRNQGIFRFRREQPGAPSP